MALQFNTYQDPGVYIGEVIVPGAVNIPLHELLDHLDHVPDGALCVHSASAAGATIATSLLGRAGFAVTLVTGGPDDLEHSS